MHPNTNILYNLVVTLVSGHTLFQVTAKRLNLFQPTTCTILSRRRFTVILQVTCNLAYSDYGPTISSSEP